MATVKKSNKKKIIIPICIILVIAIVVGAVVVTNNNKATEVSLYTIGTSDIVETVSATGDVTSGESREYKVSTIANVKEVFVKTGDSVKKGDTLATFDTDELDSQVSELQTSYNEAKTAYNNAVTAQNTAKSNLASVNSQISKLEKQVASLQAQQAKATSSASSSSSSKSSSSKSKTSETTTSKSSVSASSSASTVNSAADDAMEELDNMAEALAEIADSITKLTDDIDTMNTLLQTISQTISETIESGVYDPDKMADAVGDAVAKAIKEGLIDETKLIVDSGVAVDMVETAVKSINWSSVANEITSTTSVKLTTSEIQLASLYAEKEIFTLSADDTLVNSQKTVMDTAKKALDTIKKSQEQLSAGWVSDIDGIVTECNVNAGEQTSALTTGIKVENTDVLVATISLGEYDVHKVKVGMKATITTAYGEYDGEIATIAPTATGGSDSSLLDSVGSMAGISGLSSLTSSGAGVECTVTINDPDENIIVGFDADVEINTGEYDGVASVPIESIVLEKDGTYVYKYNESDNTVTKTKITTGAISDSYYEVTDGLEVGDKIVAIPATDEYEEDSFEVKVATKS